MEQNRLNKMLSGAKAVMNRVETGEYATGNVSLGKTDGTTLVEHNGAAGNEMPVENKTNVAPKIIDGEAQYKNMASSKLPENIKKAMMEQPIAQVSMADTSFSLGDVDAELLDKPMPMLTSLPKKQAVNEQVQQGQPIQHHGDSFTVSETALRGIIKDVVKDELLAFMSETYAKTLSEQAIKKTMNVLIKEGKLAVKRKKVNS